MYINQDLEKSQQKESNLNKYYFIELPLFASVLGLTICSYIREPFLKYKKFDFKFQRLDDAKKSKIATKFRDYELLFKSIGDAEKKAKDNGVDSLDTSENFYYNLGKQVRFIDKKLEKNDINNGEIRFGSNFYYIFYIIIQYEKDQEIKTIENFLKLLKDKKTKEMNTMIQDLKQNKNKKDIFKTYLAQGLDNIYKTYLNFLF